MTDPTSRPDAAPAVLATIERKALSLLAGTTPGRIDVHRCDADSGAIDYQLQRAPGTPATVLGYATDSDGSSRAKADATLWAHAHEMTTAVLTLAAELRAARADLARLRAPADLAAVVARAAEYTAARDEAARTRTAYAVARDKQSTADLCGDAERVVDDAAHASAADVPTLLAHIAADAERHAAEVAGAREKALREAGDLAWGRYLAHAEVIGPDVDVTDPGAMHTHGRMVEAESIRDAVAALGAKGGAE